MLGVYLAAVCAAAGICLAGSSWCVLAGQLVAAVGVILCVLFGLSYFINKINYTDRKERYYFDGKEPPQESCPPNGLNCNWMQRVPYDTLISKLSVPGTHDTMTYNKPSLWHWQWPFIQCQTWTLRSQLDAGIRFIDVRFQVVNNKIKLYHSTYDLEGKNMKDDVMERLDKFLKDNPSEFIIMRMKDETMFSRNKCKDAWDQFLQNWESLLWKPDGEIPVKIPPVYGRRLKGRVIVLSELHETSTTAKYSIPWSSDLFSKIDNFWMQTLSYEKKFQNIVTNIKSNSSKLKLNFLSGTSLTHRPRAIAVEMNNRFYQYVKSSGVTCLGVVIMDYPGMGLIDEIIKKNPLSDQAVAVNRKSDEEFAEKVAELERKEREGKLHSEYLHNVSTDLKSEYERRYRTIPFIPWDEASHIPMDDIYVPLTLQESKDKQWKRVTAEPFKNIVEIIAKHGQKEGREKPVKLIIQGNPGAGKSTTCFKLVYDWTKSDSVLADRYELVILLKARDFTPDEDLFKKISATIPDYNEDNCEELTYILLQKKLLIIIDGYDELGDKTNQTQLNQLLDAKKYQKCDLIVTTRHWCTDHLKKYPCFDQIFTICPFDDADTKSYVSKFFIYGENKNKDAVQNFMREVKKKTLDNLVKEPLTCLFLCYVWEINDGKKLPEIRAQIYDQVLSKVMKERYNKKQKIGDNWDEDKFKFNTLLEFLSKLAFEKLVTEHSILQFERKDLEKKYNIDVELACAIGILVKADPPADGKKPLMICDYYTFPHLTFQEFLAARHLYYSDVDLDQACEAHGQYSKYNSMYNFFFGHLAIESDKDITEDKLLDRVNQMAYLKIKGEIYGYGDTSIQQWEASGCNDRFPWAELRNKVLEYFIKRRTSTVHEPCIDRLRIAVIDGDGDGDRPWASVHESVSEYFKSSSSQCQARLCFSSVCQKLAQCHTLKVLILEYIECDCDSKGSSLGNLLAVNKDLEKVIIKDCGLNANDGMMMAPHLSNLNALIELRLSGNSLGESVVHIIENLCETIKSIIMVSCDISSEDAKKMAPKLRRLTLLTKFIISHNPLGPSAIDIIEKLSPSIQRLYMVSCGLSVEDVKSLAPHLERLTALEDLSLWGNVPDEGERASCKELINRYNSRVYVLIK